jgi:putative membrane protein
MFPRINPDEASCVPGFGCSGQPNTGGPEEPVVLTAEDFFMTEDNITSNSTTSEISRELSARNTGLALQRTRLAADRTLMSVIRTSLSLISFGFTISQIFEKLTDSGTLRTSLTEAPRFGLALVVLGVAMLVLGIAYHAQFMLAIRTGRRRMVNEGLIHGESPFPPSLTLITAVALLGIGIAAMISMVFHVGPFN